MPVLILMCGLPGSGKTTIAHNLFSGYSIISSDDVRKELYGSESVQKDHSKVFSIVNSRAHKLLMSGHNVVIDATHIKRKDRASSLACAKGCLNVNRVIVCVDTPVDECIRRNNNRERIVPQHVILRMNNSFEPISDDEANFVYHIK